MTEREAMELFAALDSDAPSPLDTQMVTADMLERSRRVVAELEAAFGEHLTVEAGAAELQDAPYFMQIWLNPGGLRFSNFGQMVALIPEEDMQPADERLQVVIDVVHEHGFLFVPQRYTQAPYGGHLRNSHLSRWWDRFFDWF